MTRNETASMDRLETVRRYRRLMGVCLVVGIVTYLVALEVGYVILGTVVYWTAFLAMIGIWKGTSVELYDEREQLLDLEAGGWTLSLFAVVLVFGAPGLVALEAVDYYVAPPELWGAMFGYGALYLAYGAIYVVHRYRA